MWVPCRASICLDTLGRQKLGLVSLGFWVMCQLCLELSATFYIWPFIMWFFFIGSHFNYEIKWKYLLCDLGKLIPKEEALSCTRRGMGVGKTGWLCIERQAQVPSLPPFPLPSHTSFLHSSSFSPSFLLRRVSLGTSWLWTHYIAKPGLGLQILLPLSSRCWDCSTLCPARLFFSLVVRMEPKAPFVSRQIFITEQHPQLLKDLMHFVLFIMWAKQDFSHSPNTRTFKKFLIGSITHGHA